MSEASDFKENKDSDHDFWKSELSEKTAHYTMVHSLNTYGGIKSIAETTRTILSTH